MSKELENLSILQDMLIGNGINDNINEYVKELVEPIINSIKRLESINNANPSEALECLERIEADLTGLPKHVTEYDDIFDDYLDDIWDSLNPIKQALLKVQEPKQYLKWEDLEFTRERQFIKVKLNNTEYILKYYVSVLKEEMIEILGADKSFVIGLSHTCINDKQFFNDLRLERVERMTGLEALNKIDNEVLYGVYAQEQYSKELALIEKHLKALEIIKKKNVAVAMLKSCKTVEAYNTIAFDDEYLKDKNYARKLTEDEFSLLKEVLE